MLPEEHEMFEPPHLTMRMEDGFLFCTYAKDLHLSLDVAKACVEARIFFSKGKTTLLLIDMTGIKSTTRAARQYMATVGTTQVKAAARVTGSDFNNALANFFLAVNKPMIPTRLFTDKQKAKQWLQQFKQAD
jgi:hypothetical protein